MEISVIIPSYKPQDYIWECLDSLRDQTFNKEKFEIILILNGCNEPYHTQIKNYIDNNLVGYNVNFIQTDTGGVSNARNIGLDVARGKYITFIDDDDYVSPQYLEELYQKASPDTISLCYPFIFNDICREQQQKSDLTNVYNIHYEQKAIKLSGKIRKYFSGPWMKLIPENIIGERRFDVRFKNGEDSLFMFLISDKISKLSFTSKKAIYYRRNRINSAVSLNKNKLYLLKNSFKLMFCYCKLYFTKPLNYNFKFFITRNLAILNGIFHNLKY